MAWLDRRHHRIDGHRFVVITHLGQRERRVLARGPENVHVMDTEPPLKDLDFLRPRTDSFRRLIVTDGAVRNVKAVESMHRLQEVDLFTGARHTLDLSLLSDLRSLAMHGSLKVDLTDIPKLERLVVEAPSAGLLEQLASHRHLRRVKLSRARGPIVRLPSSLEELELGAFRWQESGDAIDGLGHLRSLSLVGISGLRDMRPFAGATKLQTLYIESCRDLKSLAGPPLGRSVHIQVVGGVISHSI